MCINVDTARGHPRSYICLGLEEFRPTQLIAERVFHQAAQGKTPLLLSASNGFLFRDLADLARDTTGLSTPLLSSCSKKDLSEDDHEASGKSAYLQAKSLMIVLVANAKH